MQDWRTELIEAHPNLFDIDHGQVRRSVYPTAGDGWRELVERAVERIATAVAAASLRITQIKEKFAWWEDRMHALLWKRVGDQWGSGLSLIRFTPLRTTAVYRDWKRMCKRCRRGIWLQRRPKTKPATTRIEYFASLDMSDLHMELTRGWDLPSGDACPDFDVLITRDHCLVPVPIIARPVDPRIKALDDLELGPAGNPRPATRGRVAAPPRRLTAA